MGFSQGEIEIIQGNFTIATQGPPGFLRKMLGDYLHWAPGDARGSKDFATLESLKDAVSGAGFGTEALDLGKYAEAGHSSRVLAFLILIYI